jgi:hypothetical protein
MGVRGLRPSRMLVAALVVGVLGCTGEALAASQIKGASYSGQLAAPRSQYTVNFKVSADGKRVTDLRINNTPFYCSGGGGPVPVGFARVAISKAGTFTSTGKYVIDVGPLKGQVGTRLKLTGKFAKGGGERGTLTSTYPKTPACNGKSSYTTKG